MVFAFFYPKSGKSNMNTVDKRLDDIACVLSLDHHHLKANFLSTEGSSPTYCLLDMIHSWLSHLDSFSYGKHIRVTFLDFSKAFDQIAHNFYIEKLLDLGVRHSLIPWIMNFLCERRQRVKIGETLTSWLPIIAGVSQGTKLGPILFLIMVNVLRVDTSDTKMRKFEDDVSCSENLTSNSHPATQSTLNDISSWASNNCMKLNAKKCKEL